jgi:hypothetical protein
MNERIKELLGQAYDEAVPETWTTLSSEQQGRVYEKFAELIVGECTEQVRGQYLPVMEDTEMMKDTHWNGYVQCGVDSVVAIKEHFFGVEES